VPDNLSALSERNLAVLCQGFRERGVTMLILVGVFADKPTGLEWIARAISDAAFALVRSQGAMGDAGNAHCEA
jgi:hypothetical protein